MTLSSLTTPVTTLFLSKLTFCITECRTSACLLEGHNLTPNNYVIVNNHLYQVFHLNMYKGFFCFTVGYGRMHSSFKKLFYCCSIIVVCISSPNPPPPHPNPPPSLAFTLPFGFVHVSFIVVPENPFPHCPLPPGYW